MKIIGCAAVIAAVLGGATVQAVSASTFDMGVVFFADENDALGKPEIRSSAPIVYDRLYEFDSVISDDGTVAFTVSRYIGSSNTQVYTIRTTDDGLRHTSSRSNGRMLKPVLDDDGIIFYRTTHVNSSRQTNEIFGADANFPAPTVFVIAEDEASIPGTNFTYGSTTNLGPGADAGNVMDVTDTAVYYTANATDKNGNGSQSGTSINSLMRFNRDTGTVTILSRGGDRPNISANNLGQIAFNADAPDGQGGFADAIKLGTNLSAPVIAQEGTAAPGLDGTAFAGGVFNQLVRPALNDAGVLAFRADLNGDGDHDAIYTYKDGVLAPAVIRRGSMGTILSLQLSDNGQIAFLAEDGNETSLFATDTAGTVHKIMTTGEVMELPDYRGGTVTRTLRAMGMAEENRTAFNRHGELTIATQYDEYFSRGVLAFNLSELGEVPVPPLALVFGLGLTALSASRRR